MFSRAQLLDAVWGYTHDGYEHTVTTHINRLRAKLEADPMRPRADPHGARRGLQDARRALSGASAAAGAMKVRTQLALTVVATGLLTALLVIGAVLDAFQRFEREINYRRGTSS